MNKRCGTVLAIGGGEIAEEEDLLRELKALFPRGNTAGIVVMTVATKEPAAAGTKYRALFKNLGIDVEVVGVNDRDNAFDEKRLKTVAESGGLFFTGGNQLHITSLLGGSPLDHLLQKKFETGTFPVAGTSAGAAMLSVSMILSGASDNPPVVGGVEIGPGLGLVEGVIFDTHFSARGRHGRMMTAVAHYPKFLGIGLDEVSGAVITGDEMRIVGRGVVTVFDGSQMTHSNLPFRKDGETLALFGITIDVLTRDYTYNLDRREAAAPESKSSAQSGD